MEEKKQFVAYPHNDNCEDQPDLTPQDKLIYLAIRRYMNGESLTAFPSYARITKDTGAAAKTIKKSVDRLVAEGYLEVTNRGVGRGLLYKFNNKKKFEAFSYSFLDKQDLSFIEKAYIVASSQYMFKDEDSENGKISFSNTELSELINMPISTISKVNRRLEKKGYIVNSENTKVYQLRELDLAFAWKLKEHDDRIKSNEDKIEKLEREMKEKDEIIKQLIEKSHLNIKKTFIL